MSQRHLLLWLEAPLQSWGFDSKFDRRSSLNFPTRSGVLGLLCCAMGAGGPQEELLAEFAAFGQTVLSFPRLAPRATPENPTAQKEPLLTDFHMVSSGYDKADPWQSLMMLKTNAGKNPVGSGGKITYRQYLQDMAFAVVLPVPARLETLLDEKLTNPVWDLFLGRKNCVPTDFVYRGFFDTQAAAMEKARETAQGKNRVEAFQVVEGEAEGEVVTLNDVPLRFGPHKIYRDRQVTVCPA